MADLFSFPGVPVITTNCVGAMGAGIARQARDRFPGLLPRYRAALAAGEHGIGHPLYLAGFGPSGVLLFATKRHWRDPSELDWIASGLDAFVAGLDRHPELARLRWLFPPLGCGLGGLDRGVVVPLMHDRLAGLDYRIF